MGDLHQLKQQYKLLDALAKRRESNPLVNQQKIEEDVTNKILHLEQRLGPVLA